MRVGVDVDGVLANFGNSFKYWLDITNRAELWKSGPTPMPYWEFYKDWPGWTTERFIEECNAAADAGVLFTGPPRGGAVEAMRKLKDDGHYIIVITDRSFGKTPQVSQDITYSWFELHGIPYDEIHFSADKTVVPTDVFVEDKLENYDALWHAGTPTVLVNRPWNKLYDDRYRIDSIVEFPPLVNTLALLSPSFSKANMV